MTAGSAQGPVESWVAGALERAMPGGPEGAPRVVSVDLSGGSKLGELRARVAFPGGARPHRAVWQRLAEDTGRDPAFERVVPVPPTLYVTFAPGVLETGITLSAGYEPLIATRPVSPGVVVVFCSPNTNKPLHIGHLRACFLGMSISRLFEGTGAKVARSQMLSNFGIHMCQALAAHDGVSNPASAGLKGDHFVGALYRAYHEALAQAGPADCGNLECSTPREGQPCVRCAPSHLLRRMAAGDPALLAANRQLGEWAIEGILQTQGRVGTSHDSCLRESEVIPRAVAVLDQAVEAGVCKRRPDGSTYIPVRSTGEAELTLLRQDGTSLVFSMLLGVYLTRGDMYPGWDVVELTGEQWRAGRTAMYEVLRRIGREDLSATTEGVFFGMVQLGGEVMQSRRGTVVVADELLERTSTRVRTWDGCPAAAVEDADARGRVAASLLKYHVLRFARAEGFDFDEERMWHDASARLGKLLRILGWAEGESDDGPVDRARSAKTRRLALELARQSSVASRALSRRDPAVIVRFLDGVVDRAAALAREGAAPASLQVALADVIRRTLAFLDIDAADWGPA